MAHKSSTTKHEPSLSRRIKSCEACRKMKIKCIFEAEQAARCTRCIARNLQCHVSSNLQTILENDLGWKAKLQEQLEGQQRQIERLNAAVERLSRSVVGAADARRSAASRKRRRISKDGSDGSDLEGLRTSYDDQQDDSNNNEYVTSYATTSSRPASRGLSPPTPRASYNPASSGPDSVLPIRAIHQKQTDLISRRLLPLATAQDLFHFYLTHLDPQIYHLLRVCHYHHHATRGPERHLDRATCSEWLEEIRASSTLLLLGVLSVAALHRREMVSEVDARRGAAHAFQLLYRESSAFRAPAGCLPDFISAEPASALVTHKQHMAHRATRVALDLIASLDPTAGLFALHSPALRFAPAWVYNMLVSALVFLVKVHEMLDANQCDDARVGCDKRDTARALRAAVAELRRVADGVAEHHMVRRMVAGAQELVRQIEAMLTSAAARIAASMATLPDAAQGTAMHISQFDLLSDLHPISGLDFWPEIVTELNQPAVDAMLSGSFAS
ncbi:uncharacterized protein SRS1_13858 [Sporisorium reilianum f. sp. reilianum]|uniref:Zn(2)-C6 fungal-type domain-containing protein n=1 Tax=Sporisorium reilianum f. sp. reilianum TaxID=72559 RepID=A0A2N8UDI3_9BASI|nr:uncharacterized protein SRS1_13858 [Sporisorium reilianum f. sp. reilianum]